MSQFTYWNVAKASAQSHEHVTLQFWGNGEVYKLSRDTDKSVAPRWVLCGSWDGGGKFPCVLFNESSYDLSIAGTHLFTQGWAVTGVVCRPFEFETRCEATSNITNPDSLAGNIRGRSLELGSVAKGEAGARRFGKRVGGKVNINAMRMAIMLKGKKGK